MQRLQQALGREAYERRSFAAAARLLDEITVATEFATFLTSPPTDSCNDPKE